jgi:hypothetical protein
VLRILFEGGFISIFFCDFIYPCCKNGLMAFGKNSENDLGPGRYKIKRTGGNSIINNFITCTLHTILLRRLK